VIRKVIHGKETGRESGGPQESSASGRGGELDRHGRRFRIASTCRYRSAYQGRGDTTLLLHSGDKRLLSETKESGVAGIAGMAVALENVAHGRRQGIRHIFTDEPDGPAP